MSNHMIFKDATGCDWAFPPYALSYIAPHIDFDNAPVPDRCTLVFNTGFTAAGAAQQRVTMAKSPQAVLDDIKAWYAAQPNNLTMGEAVPASTYTG